MSWEKVKLGDIADFSNGVNFGKSAYGKGIKLIGVSDFGNRLYPDYESLNEISSDVVRNNDYLKNGDIVFVRSNGNKELVGRCMLIKDIPDRVTFSGFCIRARLKNTEYHNPVYWTYHFKWNVFRQAMSGTANGANIQNLSQGRLAIYEALIPDIEIQNKIASILSSYDDLIENNEKQIKLLEEAAQRLYKEWFVDFRFPGHEQVQIIDGVPTGWKRCIFSEITSIMSGGTPKTNIQEYYDGNIPFYTPKDSDDSFFSFDTITHISDSGLKNCNSQYYPAGTVIITARGTVGKTTILAVPMTMNQSCYAIKCDILNSPYYLFFSLNQEVASLRTMANGGVFNTIIKKTFDSIHIDIPTQDVLTRFNGLISPIMEQIKMKMRQKTLLSEARNRLLPKLMSGEINF